MISPAPAEAHPTPVPSWQDFSTGSASSLRGLSAVSRRVAWASGSEGEVLRTLDGGRTWSHVGPPGTAELQFRDIEAFDADHAVLMSIGDTTDAFRFYVTSDGGAHWTETFRNTEAAAFYDCMAFFDRRHGIALSDPVDGKFRILATSDGGRTWAVAPDTGMPAALAGEFAFAASGTCLTVSGGEHAWFASGGGSAARVYRSNDRGRTWSVTDTPVPSGASAGIYSVAFRDPRHGIIVGGDYTTPDSAPDGAAVSRDGGRTWTVGRTVPGAYRSGVAWTNIAGVAIAVGPTGSDITYDGGQTWHGFDTGSLHGVDCTRDGACWASGAAGRVTRLTL
ncbi:WD40/YVTN/BNR-like repeat-containing protein [Hamadaea tsunoensis]|uniref:WD40/YVTN/BNR-like repeat-containing protein n=1 Tax=Hamadaea tsunoensis TaxID=53368 RepID=UPI001FE013D9|nr:oxidoreductase [Hamadaea tsunoensis]